MVDKKDLDIKVLRRDILGENLFAGDLASGTSVGEMSIDLLTGLLPRVLWEAEMKQHYEYARRAGKSFSVALLDLDKFKNINDNYGHLAGDEMPRKLGKAVEKRFRAADIKGGYGGDEVIVMLADFSPDDQELRKEEKAISEFLANQVSNRVSVGIACWNGSETLEEVIKRADKQLYKNKNG